METVLLDAVNFPTYAACYHEYGDTNDMSSDDILAYKKWIASLKASAKYDYPEAARVDILLQFEDEEFFSNYPAFGLPSTCMEATPTILIIE